jgi:hypothetical protein
MVVENIDENACETPVVGTDSLAAAADNGVRICKAIDKAMAVDAGSETGVHTLQFAMIEKVGQEVANPESRCWLGEKQVS